jgi:hypothetical protein
MGYLHILNGDATLTSFRQSSVPGEVVICREMMCEGKVKATQDTTAFFETRAKHLEYQYGIDKQTYYTNVVQELEKLKTAGTYEEIVLWFEFDLFCQINMLFVLHYLRTISDNLPPISLVAIDAHAEIPDFKGMGMLAPRHFPPLFEQRKQLTPEDLQLAADVWAAYCQPAPLELEVLSNTSSANLPYLGKAMKAHLKRLPAVDNGLNNIETFFLQRLLLGNYRWYDLYAQFWKEMKIYGLGDFQLDIYLQRMRRAGIIEQEDQQLSITSLGKEVLANEENYIDYVSLQHRWLGGVRLLHSPWRWDRDIKRVVAISQ